MTKKVKPTSEKLLYDLLKIHIPENYIKYFELHEVINRPDCYELILYEKEDLIPKELKGNAVILDGFCNPVSILSHSFSMKKIYLVIYRRRWKIAGTGKHYSNDYDLYPEGAKITRDLAFFFKGLHRGTTSKS